MNPEGNRVKRLTHTKVDPLLQGLFPTEWSANGSRLLAEFEGQDTSYAVTVNPQTGAQRPCSASRSSRASSAPRSPTTARPFSASPAASNPAPTTTSPPIPYAGGKPKVLVKNAFEPDWSR